MIELTEQQQKELEECNKALAASATVISLIGTFHKNEPEWYRNILLALLKAAARECQRLKTGLNDGDQALLAWACRNLLELSVFVKYVLQSDVNAEMFHKDSLVDFDQIFRVAGNWALKDLPERQDQVAQITENINDLKQLAGITTDKYLRASNLVATVGDAAEYDAIHKICSKYVHPTAFSILVAHEQGISNMLDWAFFQHGAFFSAQICKDITLYIAEKAQADRTARS